MRTLVKGPSTMRVRVIEAIGRMAADVTEAIRLQQGQPDFPTPEHIVEAACKAARAGYTEYTLYTGLQCLRELIVEKLERVNHLKASPENVTVAAGDSNAVFAALVATVEENEEVLIPDPHWPTYECMAACIGAVPKSYHLNPQSGFLPEVAELEDLVTERTKVLVMNSPSNPTGAVFPRGLAEDLVAFADRRDLYVVSDEPYEEMVFEGEHVSPGVFDDETVVGCYSFSKTYAMTGWRLGYTVASKEIAKVITKVVGSDVDCASSISQKAGEAALSGSQDCVRMMRESYRERRDLAMGVLIQRGARVHKPESAFYLWLDISGSHMSSTGFAEVLLKEKRVAVAPGDGFSQLPSSWVRICLATGEGTLREGIDRTCSFLDERA